VSNPSPLSVDATAMLPQVAPAPSQGQLLTQERQAERETISAGDFASAVVENDWMASNIRRIEAEQGFADDPAWVVPATKDEKAWEGIPHQDRHKLFDSRSAEHFAWMKDQYAREQATEKELAKAGLWAIPARLALNMGDPLALVASVSTGSGILAKSSRLTNAVRAGLVAGGTNAAIEGVLAKGSQSLDGSDVVLGALAGFAIGAPIGAAIKPRDYDTIQRSLARLSDERRVDLIVEQARAEGVNLNREDVLARMAEQQNDVGGFGGDSVGSARAFTYDPVRDTFVETDEPVAQMAFHQLPTYAGVLRGHKNETVRNGLGLLVDDPIGTIDGSVSHIGATSEKYRIEQVHREQFNTQANLAFEEWLESQNVTMTRAFVTTELPKLRDQFMREVGRAAFGDPDPNISAPAIRLAAQLKSNHFKKLGDELLDTGVIDEALEDYTPVRWQSHLIDQYIEGVDPAHRKFGLEGIEEVFYRGFDNTELAGEIRVSAIARERARVEAAGGVFDDAALELAHKVAEQTVRKFVSGFVRRTREVGRGIEMDAIFGINTKTPQYVRELILDNGGDLQLAEIIEDAVTRKVAKFKADDKGKPPVGKHRTDFTRLAGVWLTDQNSPTGEKVFVRVIDLMETNAEHLFNGYIGGASGRIAAARVAGLKTDGDFNLLLDKVRAALPDEKDRLNVIARAEETWKHLTGRPLEDHPGSFYSRAGRVVRNYNMGRVGWTFGLAQIADLGNVVSIGGIRAFHAAAPLADGPRGRRAAVEQGLPRPVGDRRHRQRVPRGVAVRQSDRRGHRRGSEAGVLHSGERPRRSQVVGHGPHQRGYAVRRVEADDRQAREGQGQRQAPRVPRSHRRRGEGHRQAPRRQRRRPQAREDEPAAPLQVHPRDPQGKPAGRAGERLGRDVPVHAHDDRQAAVAVSRVHARGDVQAVALHGEPPGHGVVRDVHVVAVLRLSVVPRLRRRNQDAGGVREVPGAKEDGGRRVHALGLGLGSAHGDRHAGDVPGLRPAVQLPQLGAAV
jgi:hypothetical protein